MFRPRHLARGDASQLEKFADVMVDHDDLEPITDAWREQILGRFLRRIALPGHYEDDVLHIADGKITGGVGITLEIETYGEATIQREHFLRAIKIADRIKIAEVEGFPRMFFKGSNVRGTIATCV